MNDVMSSDKPVLDLQGVARTFRQGGVYLNVLKNINLQLQPGEIVSLVGPSGSGKSTLLQIAGLLEHPTAGEVLIEGNRCGPMNDARRTALRCGTVGFIYQFHHLLPEFTALENIALPQMIAGVPQAKAHAHASTLLKTLGLEERMDHRPSKLSGGEQQRVAILRALANKPRLLLADEPTGNLDEATAEIVFNELVSFVRNSGMAALIATHNQDLARRSDRILTLRNGVLI